MSRKQTFTEKQAAQLESLDAQIAEAEEKLQAAQDAQRAADAAGDAQGIVNAKAAAKSAQGDLDRLEAIRKAVAFVPEPEPQDAYLPAVAEMQAAYQDRIAKLESQIADANARLQVIDAALEAATIKADVAEAAKLTAERDQLEAQNGVAYDLLAKAKALPIYDSTRLRELWDVEDARIGREWRVVVDNMVACAAAYRRAWAAVERVRGNAWDVARAFKGYLQRADDCAELDFERGLCYGTADDKDATDLQAYRKGSFILSSMGHGMTRGTRDVAL